MEEVHAPVSGPDEDMTQTVARLWAGDQLRVKVTFEPTGETDDDGKPLPGITKMVTIRKARVRELSKTLGFFNELLPKIDPQRVEDIIKLFTDLETANILKGDPAQKIDLTPRLLIEKFGDRSGLITEALRSAVNLIPPALAIYTDLTEEESDTLLLNDALLVITGVIGANYDFFIQSVLPTLRVVIADWRLKGNAQK